MSQSTTRTERRRQPSRGKHTEIHRQILEWLESGKFAPGHPLPKERDLAASLGVALSVVRRALAELEADGFIRRIRGKGTFVNSPQERRKHIRGNAFSLVAPSFQEDPFPPIVDGFEQAAKQLGHRVMIGSSGNDVSQQEKLIRQAIADKVAGVAIAPTEQPLTPAGHIRLLQEHHIPVVFCHRAVEGVFAPLVTWSRADVGRKMTEILLKQGHTHIVALVDLVSMDIEVAGGGSRYAFREHGVDPSNYSIRAYRAQSGQWYSREGIRPMLEQLLRERDRPTAIQCFNSTDAEHVYMSVGELGLKIPDDLSLIYFGATQRRSALAEQLTCLGIDECEVGAQACSLLAKMNAGLVALDSNEKRQLPLTLLPGQSVGPAP